MVLVPSYEPDARLLDLVTALREAAPEATVLVVDDGSGPEYALAFDLARAAGAEVVGHPANRGKGAALKTGFRHALANHPGETVVCADSDGQHRVADILRVAAAAEAHQEGWDAHPLALVLGGRRFTGEVPARSRLGNTVSRLLFRAATGQAVGDTQTGLRAYPPALLPWLLELRGERFEYELTVLLEAGPAGHRIVELEIETVYLDRNASSHFRPVVDSWRVLRPLLGYAASSAGAFVLDLVLLQLLMTATGSLLVAAVGARAVSATVNFAVNRQLVFRGRRRRPAAQDALRYAALAAALLGANVLLLEALTWAGLPLVAAKLLTEATLYLVGFAAQRRVVFAARLRRPSRRSRHQTEAGEPSAGVASAGEPASADVSAEASAGASEAASAFAGAACFDDFFADWRATSASFSAFSDATVDSSRPGSGRSRNGLVPPVRE
nr:glycosyltransferase family 2 protein [Herbiconiux sp. VKM Ac-2851]